jgi:hypothetical protein
LTLFAGPGAYREKDFDVSTCKVTPHVSTSTDTTHPEPETETETESEDKRI